MITVWLGSPLASESIKVATFAAPLSREGPGLLLRDLVKASDAQITAIEPAIAQADADVLVLTDFDFDANGHAADALIANLEHHGTLYRHSFALEPNAGQATGLDLDGNGKKGEPRDAQGYGRFLGDGGLLILSRCPLALAEDHSARLWRDLPLTRMPPETPDAIKAVQRLSSSGHWVLDVDCGPTFQLAVFAATPPVFDGEEERNDRRNADEITLWTTWASLRPTPFVIAGNANLDPHKGEGYHEAIISLLELPTLQDPLPDLDTAFWPPEKGGNLRVSYVLPSTQFDILDAGIIHNTQIGAHALVWIEISADTSENKRVETTLSP